MPVIVIELVLVFGGVLLFGWWQLRDLDRERERRRQAQAAAGDRPEPDNGGAAGNSSPDGR